MLRVKNAALGSLRNEQGVALPMVLLIFLVGFALVTAFLLAIVGSANVSTTTRAGIQAQAAAEAGIATAEAAMRTASATDPCDVELAPLNSAAEPAFTFATATPICNDLGDERQVMIQVEGFAPNGQSSRVEATYNWIPGGDPTPPQETESIVYTGSGTFPTYPGVSLSTVDGNPTQITVQNDSFTCNGITVPGSVLVGGNVSLTPCTVQGGVHLAGVFTTNSSSSNSVLGDILAAGNGDPHVLSGTMRGNVYVNGRAQLHNSGVIHKNLTVAGTGETEVHGTVQGNVTTAGRATVSGRIDGDLVASSSGATTISGTVSGNVVVGGAATVSGVVSGNLTAFGTNKTTITGIVRGNVYAEGPIELGWNARIEGNLITSDDSALTVQGEILGNIVSNGSVTVNVWNREYPGTIKARGAISLVGGNRIGQSIAGCTVGSVSNQIHWNQPPSGVVVAQKTCQIDQAALGIPQFSAEQKAQLLAAPEAVKSPVIPAWKAYAFEPAAWAGYEVITVTGSTCDDWRTPYKPEGAPWGVWESAWDQLQTVEHNTVFDLRQCGAISTNNGNIRKQQVLSHDVALLINSANLTGLQVSAAAGANPTLRLITPGGAAGSAPVCSTSSTSVTFNNTTIALPVLTMVYTPCTVHLGGAEFAGNVYAGNTTVGGSPKLTFASIGLPGWSTTGAEEPGGSDPSEPGGGSLSIYPTLGSQLYQRNY